MVHRCAVKGCNNYQNYNKKIKNSEISFFRIPKNTTYREAWLSVCSKTIKSWNYARVCSEHFRPECFKPMSASVEYIHKMLNTVPRSLKKLKADAIPTENLKTVRNSKSDTVSASEIIECCSLMENDQSADEFSSEAANNDGVDISENEKLPETSDNTINASTDEDFPEAANGDRDNMSENERLTETMDNINHASTDEDFSKANGVILDEIFSLLPEGNFDTEENKNIFLHRLQQVKEKCNERMEELQKNAEKERRENGRLKKQRREQCDAFLLQFLELKKSEAYWKKKCFLNGIKLYCAESNLKRIMNIQNI